MTDAPKDLTPDQIRDQCSRKLMAAGMTLLTYSGVIMSYALRASKRVKVGSHLKNSIKAVAETQREIHAIAQVLHDLEQCEAASRPLPKPGPRVPAAVRQQGNIIVGAFAPPVSPPDAPTNGLAS